MIQNEGLSVSEKEANIIASLFEKGIGDFNSIVSALKWSAKKRALLWEYCMDLQLFDIDLLDKEQALVVPKNKYEEFFQELPIKLSEAFFDDAWYCWAYITLRDFLITFDKESTTFKDKKFYSLDDVRTIIGMAFCPITHKPEKLCSEIQGFVCVSLTKLKKDTFLFKEILDAFENAFQNFVDYCAVGNEFYDQAKYPDALKWWLKAAEQGNIVAQYNIGVCYDRGQGVTQSYTEAVKWYGKAANQGYADAQCNLGNCYFNGWGVTQSYIEAVKWYRKAAEQGDAYAQYCLALCYEEGQGVAQSYIEAIKWHRKAAEQGDADAQEALRHLENMNND